MSPTAALPTLNALDAPGLSPQLKILALLTILSLLPATYPSPDRALRILPDILRNCYDTQMISRVVMGSVAASFVLALVGLICFGRRDV